jgi:diguanylate cyclase (GGDEF)-like protein/PAS domain S-box-containing protein
MEAAFRSYVEQCPDAVLVTDPGGRIVYVNPAFERMTGYACDELAGRTPAMLKSGQHEADFYRRLWSTILAGHEFRALFANRRKNGEAYYEDKIIRPLFDADGRITHFLSFGRDATERAREFEKLSHAATHDSLTDLPNRSLFLDRLGQALRHASRREEAVTLAIFDIDRFRDTNNRHGHLAGDAVLQAVAARTRACVREADTVARIGGDEFAIILVGTAERDAASVLAKVVAANAQPVRHEQTEIHATVSVGASGYPRDAKDEQALRKQADAAMYVAKAAGGNRYGFYRRA